MERKNNRFFIIYVFIGAFFAVPNIMFETDFAISMLFVILQIIILLFFLIKLDFKNYLLFYLLFVSIALEFAEFNNDVVYGIKTMNILGLNLSAVLLLPVLFFGIFNVTKLMNIERRAPLKFISVFLLINIIAFFTGLILIIFNDNNVNALGDTFLLFANETYSMLFIPLSLGVALPVLLIDNNYSQRFRLALQGVLVVLVIQTIAAVIFNQYGIYGGLKTLQTSNAAFFIPFLMLVILDKKSVFRVFCFVFGIIGSVIYLFYNSSGKSILVLALVFMSFFVLLITRFKTSIKIATIVGIPIFIVLIVNILPLFYSNYLFDLKIKQVFSVLNIFSTNWFQSMAMSPKIRIIEFQSIFYEYLSKPIFAVFGKGYLGTTIDHKNLIFSNVPSENVFVTAAEWSNGIFYNFHEAALIFLKFGYFGLFFLFFTTLKGIKSFIKSKSPYILIGVLWFTFFYGYSYVLSIFGFCALIYGFYSSPSNVLETAPISKKISIRRSGFFYERV